MLVCFFVILGSLYVNAGKKYSVISNGYLQSDFPSQNTLVGNQKAFNKLIDQLEISDSGVEIDFSKQSVAFIVPDSGLYPDQVFIKEIEQGLNNDGIKLRYIVSKIHYVLNKGEVLEKPFMIATVDFNSKDHQISFIYDGPAQPIYVNQSLGDLSKYTNVLKQLDNELFIKYIPLDKGNSWTYNFETSINSGEQTFTIVSFADGWSVFDNYFGKVNLGMKIDTAGNVFISSKRGISAFYTDKVRVRKSKSPYTVTAGSFDDVIIVTSPENSGFKFKDVYVKDIGLIYHEHKSPRGFATYSLSKAKIRGLNVP